MDACAGRRRDSALRAGRDRSGEYTREVARKPYAIGGYIYSNDLRLADFASFSAGGFAANAKWLDRAASDDHSEGRQIFLMQCGICHSTHGYRAMAPRVQGWDRDFATDLLQHLPVVRGTMPPFAGNEHDRVALATYLASLRPVQSPESGRQVFAQRCSMCHTVGGKFRPLQLGGVDADSINGLLEQLDVLNPEMPPFLGSEAERKALAGFLQSGATFEPGR